MIEETIIALLSEILGMDETFVTKELLVGQEDGVALLDMAKLIVACEKKYAIDIFDEDIVEMQNLGDLITYVENKVCL